MIRKLFVISLVWAVLILILCAIPGNSLPKSPLFNIPHFDKIVHAGLYFPLAIFLVAEFDLSASRLLRLAGAVFTLILVAAYGGLIELLQEHFFVNRSADIVDFLADLAGGMGGITIYYLFFRPFFHRLSSNHS